MNPELYTLIGVLVVVAVVIARPLIEWIRGNPAPRTIQQPLQVREDKPLEQRFAAAVHDHSHYIAASVCAERHRRQEDDQSRQFAAVSRQIEELGKRLDEGFRNVKSDASNRTKDLHDRIEKISTPLNQWIGRLETHMEQDAHRRTPPL